MGSLKGMFEFSFSFSFISLPVSLSSCSLSLSLSYLFFSVIFFFVCFFFTLELLLLLTFKNCHALKKAVHSRSEIFLSLSRSGPRLDAAPAHLENSFCKKLSKCSITLPTLEVFIEMLCRVTSNNLHLGNISQCNKRSKQSACDTADVCNKYKT